MCPFSVFIVKGKKKNVAKNIRNDLSQKIDASGKWRMGSLAGRIQEALKQLQQCIANMLLR